MHKRKQIPQPTTQHGKGSLDNERHWLGTWVALKQGHFLLASECRVPGPDKLPVPSAHFRIRAQCSQFLGLATYVLPSPSETGCVHVTMLPVTLAAQAASPITVTKRIKPFFGALSGFLIMSQDKSLSSLCLRHCSSLWQQRQGSLGKAYSRPMRSVGGTSKG